MFQPHWVCPCSCVCAFPVYTAQASVCSTESRPWVVCTSQALATQIHVLGYSTKAQSQWGLRFLPSLSEQLRQPGAWRAHSPQVQPALFPLRPQSHFQGALVRCALCLFWGADFWLWPSQQMSTIQNLRKSLVGDWKPVCSLVGDAISGATFDPFPSPWSPASGGGWANPQPASFSLGFSQSLVLGTGG